ncbi:E3 ubiquitin-protein ligase TRIM71-like isoform X3 [Bolinopsis microptera]
MKFEQRSDIKPRVVSIEKQLESIRSVYPESSRAGSDSLDDENTEDEMEIEEENVIEVKKDMAILAVRSIKSLDCPLCTERFQHPRILPCMHTFCSSCIQKRISEENAVSCPICLRNVKLNLPTVDLLPINAILDKHVKLVEAGEETTQEKEVKTCSTCEEFSLYWCLECETDFCEKCKKVHLNIKAVSNHQLLTHKELKENIAVTYVKSENCVHHKEHELNLYCEPCDAMICRDCTLINHKNHNYGFVKEFTSAKRRKLQEEVERARAKIEPLKRLIDAVEEDTKESEHDEKVKQEIKEATESLIAQMKAQEKTLLEEISTKAKSRSDRLRGKYKELRYAVDSSQCSLDFMSALFYQGNMKDLVGLAPLVRTRIAEITAYRPEVELNRRIPKFKLCPISKMPSLGRVYGSFNYCSIGENPHLLGTEGQEAGDFKFPTGVTFHPLGYVVVVDRANSLQIFEKTGSFLEEITTMNTNLLGQLKNPNGVAVDKAGYFYVADSSKHRIAVYSPKGKFTHEIGARGKTQPHSPVIGHSVERSSSLEGSPVDTAHRKPYRSDEHRSPAGYYDYKSAGLSVSTRDHIRSSRDYRDSWDYRDYRDSRDYRDNHHHRDSKRKGYDSYIRRDSRDSLETKSDVTKRETSDPYLPKKIKLNPADVELKGPRGVEISRTGLVVVADTTNHCVKVFTREGVYLRTIGEEGALPGQLRTPSGVSLDSLDNVYVTDTELHRITAYKITGTIHHSLRQKRFW